MGKFSYYLEIYKLQKIDKFDYKNIKNCYRKKAYESQNIKNKLGKIFQTYITDNSLISPISKELL